MKIVSIKIQKKNDAVLTHVGPDYSWMNFKKEHGYGDCLFKVFHRFFLWDIIVSYK